MENHYLILLALIICGGLLGGLVNYFKKDYTKFEFNKFFKSLLFGISAAFLIPIFLKLIQSNMIQANEVNTFDYFVIFGFCLAAGIFSTNFIDNLGKKVLNIQDDLNKTNEELENLVTEKEEDETYKRFDFRISDKEFNVLREINNSKFIYRAISMIAFDLQQENEDVREKLENLQKKNLVELVDRPTGKKWRITDEGKEYITFFYREIDESSG